MLVKTEIVRDEKVNPYIRKTYVPSGSALMNANDADSYMSLVQSVDDEAPVIGSMLELEEVQEKQETMLDKFFGDPYVAAKSLTHHRELLDAIKDYGASMSTDDYEKLVEFFQMKTKANA